MAHAIRISEFGGTDKLRWEEVIVGEPGPGEVRVKSTAIGLNFIDTYHRTGLYPNQLPLTLGMEGAGIVEKVGPKVKEFGPMHVENGRIYIQGAPMIYDTIQYYTPQPDDEKPNDNSQAFRSIDGRTG